MVSRVWLIGSTALRRRSAAMKLTVPDRGPESHGTGERGRYACGPAGIGAEPGRRDARGQGHRGPARRAAGDALGGRRGSAPDPRRDVEVRAGDAERQLVHVGLAEHDGAGIEQFLAATGAFAVGTGAAPRPACRPSSAGRGVLMLSFTTIGRPASGPSVAPAARSSSTRVAASSAPAALRVMNTFSVFSCSARASSVST